MMRRRVWAGEGVGTGVLLYMIVGSGAAAERLTNDPAVTLFAHAVVVGATLTALIWALGPVSGAHFNPVVTLALWRSGMIDRQMIATYVMAQLAGGVSGALLANLSFDAPAVALSGTSRMALGTAVSEVVATFVLVLVILVLVRIERSELVAPAVGAWVLAIVFGTASTGFANPAVTVARTTTSTYTGIAPSSVPGFVAAQIVGAVLAVVLATVLVPTKETVP